mgnify:FL=1|jgi:hypothetical protein
MIEWRVRRTASQYKLGRPHLCVIAAAQALRPRLHGVASRIRGPLLAARQPSNWAGAPPQTIPSPRRCSHSAPQVPSGLRVSACGRQSACSVSTPASGDTTSILAGRSTMGKKPRSGPSG